MHWIIQSNLFNDNSKQELLDALDRLDVYYTLVKVIPFSGELEPEIVPYSPVMVYGSTTFVLEAHKRGWKPGVFWNDKLDMKMCLEHWQDNILNADGYIEKFSDIVITEPMFIRPISDLKDFSGNLVNPEEFHEWKTNLLEYRDCTVTKDTLCLVAPPKELQFEYRLFVVDGTIVTGSQYRKGIRVISDKHVPDEVLAFGQQMINIWQPELAFVLDVAKTESDELKIIEINNINSSGFYKANLQKLIVALERLPYEKDY